MVSAWCNWAVVSDSSPIVVLTVVTLDGWSSEVRH